MLAILLVLLASLAGTAWADPSGSRTYTLDADFDEGTLVNLNHDDVADQLQLDSEATPFEFIWVAASGRGTIVKIDTVTGAILGEYWSAPQPMAKNPSRTTVDSNGNVWAGNRNESGGGQGSVVHIGLQENGQCVDRNSNGVIDTSTGLGDIKAWTNSGGADTNGGVSTAADECIIHFVRTSGTNVRTLAVDASNNIWIGGYGNRVHQLYNSSGVPIGPPISLGCGGYGGIIDANGVLWSASLWPSDVGRIDPSTPSYSCISIGRTSYGLGIDSSGNIWNSNYDYNTVTKIDSTGAVLGVFSTSGASGDRGVTVTPDDNVWVANSWGNDVSRLNNDGSFVTLITVGSTPTGLAVDAAGKVWVTNYSSHNAMRIDPSTNSVDLTVDLGAGAYPYNYSDMTGATLIAPPGTGTWTVVYDSTQVGASWSLVSWNSDEPGDSQITVKVASSADGVTFGPEASVGNGATPPVADGQYIKVIVSFQRATTGESPVLYDLTVSTNQPPVADANGPYSVQEDLTITLDGTGSSDPDGDPLTFEWDLDNDGVFETSGATPSFSRPDPGIYPVTLKVCDAYLCDTDTVDVYVTIEPGLFPSEVTAYLIAGESFTEDKTVNVPPRPPKADVVFAFDLTGSMWDIIGTAKTKAGDIMSQLNSISGVEIQFGLMSYMDYPAYYNSCGYGAPYGDGGSWCGDYAYQLDQAITSDTGVVSAGINGLIMGCGGDGPQDYTRIFYESYADPSVGWRAGAKKILLNFGDNVPHDCNLNEGLYGGTWSTGCDPGRDEVAGTSDDLDLQTVLAEMDAAGVTLLESHTTSWNTDYWQYWTGLTGGDVFITSSSTLVDDIVGSITSTLESGLVSGLHLEGSPGFEDWISSEFKDVDPGEIGVSVPFEAVFTVPAGTEPGEYNFTVYAVDEDGVIYGEQSVTIHVLPPTTITDSGLCTFDVLPDVDGDQFRLIFTPDMQNWPQYKLPASNPGQFYYNVFYAGDGPVNLDISIPEPFEGQGANPVHVYQGRTVNVYGDTICFEPDYDSEIFAGTLDELPSDLPGGFLYVAIHLDYGLKGTTGYVPNFNNDAMNADETEVLIPNFFDYIFSVSGSQTDSQVIQNTNEFKKIPGFGGLVTDGVNPVEDATVEIYLNGELLATELTDEDGWYMFVYKHTGKPAEFKVTLDGMEVTGTLKANKFVEASFELAP